MVLLSVHHILIKLCSETIVVGTTLRVAVVVTVPATGGTTHLGGILIL